jgi:antitoxin (DNA-binding transcriptional repressor) of toxin-antitoxin stability system
MKAAYPAGAGTANQRTVRSLDEVSVRGHTPGMQAVTIREAKARLNALVEAAQRGEQVVLMRGARHVALIVPLTEADLEVSPRLTDAQAARLWAELATGVRDGTSVVMERPEKAVEYLSRVAPTPRPTSRSPRKPGRRARR